MNKRSVEAIFPPPPAHMVGDGFRVHGFFPGGPITDKQRMSPFFMMDYNSKIDFPPTNTPRGVGVHPHRGFETVTIAYKGSVAHHDSAGHSGVIGEGDVQWMTAASGLLHKEYHEENFAKKGGTFQMVQLWVNLPAKYKMTPPKYQEIVNSNMGKLELANNAGYVEVIAGSYNGTKGPASTFTPVEMYNAKLKKGGKVNFSFPATNNTAFLMIEGSANINGQQAKLDHLALMKNDGEDIEIEALEDAIILVLSGQPINEPISSYGPFVMNTWSEIEQAVKDFNSGKFGVLED
jgi:redox-sensitive bicupin YhaK (pirin superfamily)